jgi:hypothetical protein
MARPEVPIAAEPSPESPEPSTDQAIVIPSAAIVLYSPSFKQEAHFLRAGIFGEQWDNSSLLDAGKPGKVSGIPGAWLGNLGCS